MRMSVSLFFSSYVKINSRFLEAISFKIRERFYFKELNKYQYFPLDSKVMAKISYDDLLKENSYLTQ
jgi:hypothetical protein